MDDRLTRRTDPVRIQLASAELKYLRNYKEFNNIQLKCVILMTVNLFKSLTLALLLMELPDMSGLRSSGDFSRGSRSGLAYTKRKMCVRTDSLLLTIPYLLMKYRKCLSPDRSKVRTNYLLHGRAVHPGITSTTVGIIFWPRDLGDRTCTVHRREE
jgi:hypothetical protein